VRIITAWHHNPPQVTVKGFKKCCLSNALDGTDDGIFGMTGKRMGMSEVSARKTNKKGPRMYNSATAYQIINFVE
jgi:hypothetical protein